ncbi:MAG: hypothetical protein HXS48_17865 [Theionarchaea archaeon]|nr:hypothetical protein [Theionarchaea archaeon]
MKIWKVVLVTLREYHKKRYIYYLFLFCVVPIVIIDIGLMGKPGWVEYVLSGAEAGIGLCTFSLIFLGMLTYSPRLESGEIVLDITKPVTRADYFLGRVSANMLVGVICAGGVVLSSFLLIYRYEVVSELILRVCAAMMLPLFILSFVSLVNLYLPTKATGITAFIVYIVYGSVVDYLTKNGIDPYITIMGRSVSVVSVTVLAMSIALITCGTILFNRKEL